MQAGIRLPNAIWWVQTRLSGGRRIFYVAAVYTFFLAGSVIGARLLLPLRITFGEIVDKAIIILACVQGLILLLAGTNAVFRALERDYKTEMSHSHRLTPMSSSAVVAGYLLGPTVQALLLWLVGMLFGAALLKMDGQGVTSWFVGNALLLSTALLFWSCSVCLGVGENKPFTLAGLAIAAGFVGWIVLIPLPGLGFFGGWYSAAAAWIAMRSGFALQSSTTAVTATGGITPVRVALLVGINTVLSIIWLAAARQRYRRPDRAGFTPPLAILFLLLWLILAAAAIPLFQAYGPRGLVSEGSLPQFQFVAALAVSFLWAILPVSSACIDRARLVKGATPRFSSERVPGRLMALVAALMVCGVFCLINLRLESLHHGWYWSVLSSATASRWAMTALAFLAGLLTVEAFLRIMYLRVRRAASAVAWLLMMLWLLPPGIDYLVGVFRERHASDPFAAAEPTWLFGCSPMGTLIGTWDLVECSVIPGLIVQWAVVALLVTLAARAENREINTRRAEGLQLPGLRHPSSAITAN